jgi:Holliday junction resolvasome RuvABC endonuclease subunit
MAFIGIDQALQKTGVCVLREGNDADLYLVQPRKLSGPARLAYIRDAVRDILWDQPIQFGAIENGSFNSEGQLFSLGGVNGALQVLLWENHIGFAHVAPSQLKKFLTKKSGAQKEWMMEAATEFLGRAITEDNLADAVGLARIARATQLEDVTTRAQAEVVHKLQTSKNYFTWPTNTEPG